MTQFSWTQPPDPIPEKSIARQEQADMVIIGAGHAGTCAARAAAEEMRDAIGAYVTIR